MHAILSLSSRTARSARTSTPAMWIVYISLQACCSLWTWDTQGKMHTRLILRLKTVLQYLAVCTLQVETGRCTAAHGREGEKACSSKTFRRYRGEERIITYSHNFWYTMWSGTGSNEHQSFRVFNCQPERTMRRQKGWVDSERERQSPSIDQTRPHAPARHTRARPPISRALSRREPRTVWMHLDDRQSFLGGPNWDGRRTANKLLEFWWRRGINEPIECSGETVGSIDHGLGTARHAHARSQDTVTWVDSRRQLGLIILGSADGKSCLHVHSDF